MICRASFLLLLLFSISACDSDASNGRFRAQSSMRADAPRGSGAMELPGASPDSMRNPVLKKTLRAELEALRKDNAAGSRSSDIQTLITELNSLSRALGITARALDRNSMFATEIRTELRKLAETDRERQDEAGRIMNGMSGVYGMYALLAKMKFVGNAEMQTEIQKIHDGTVTALRPDAPAVDAAAAIAEACYALSTMIIKDIDSEQRYVKAFAQIDEQYERGVRVGKKQEDLFINGMFRTFEVSQLWLLSINPRAGQSISELNEGVSADSGEATNVGMQMGIAVKYLFLISYLIAQDTVNLTL